MREVPGFESRCVRQRIPLSKCGLRVFSCAINPRGKFSWANPRVNGYPVYGLSPR